MSDELILGIEVSHTSYTIGDSCSTRYTISITDSEIGDPKAAFGGSIRKFGEDVCLHNIYGPTPGKVLNKLLRRTGIIPKKGKK